MIISCIETTRGRRRNIVQRWGSSAIQPQLDPTGIAGSKLRILIGIGSSFPQILDTIMDLDSLADLDDANFFEAVVIEVEYAVPIDIVPLECGGMM